ncbi:hypothetical protein CTEN210_04062 [Chaetoceros tenuissimus]|uniref:pyridoxal kinase n=1 Tax=Chaetoceros tenuissimus TaxID=426638 RepID=A0AAD3CK86_9STRA|nr:hypothetical protein CTEN210_04062 [Chaetoceros tenuissimus]
MRVLSIQSHVVHGYVGNKAATFPMQLLGFDVDVINSVQFCNHTGYKNKWTGDILNGSQLDSLREGLERNDLLKHVQFLLTGYIGSESFLRAILRVVQSLKEHTDGFRYVCDPVIGDHGNFYVPKELVEIYRDEVIPIANVITPNQFEVEQLTGIKIENLEDAKKAIHALHTMGPELVVLTSIMLEEGKISILGSKRLDDGKYDLYKVQCPTIEGSYTGTGDVTTALILAWSAKESDIGKVLEKTVSTMYKLIEATKKESDGTVAGKELKLIKCKKIIEDPPSLFTAEKL